eukprot:Rhum_TRINITY_DN2196_c0_g1::Rhum_TRINITY_DN2196_c0_g1_i1::g.6262::m.6262
MQFARWPARGGTKALQRCVVVDSLGARAGGVSPALVLSHHQWPRGTARLRSSALLKHGVNSSTDEALAWAAETGGRAPAGARHVTADHYDIDSALSVWTVLHPAEALRHKALLSAASNIGDFRHYAHLALPPGTAAAAAGGDSDEAVFDAALRLACHLNTLEREVHASKPFKGTEVEGEKLEVMVAEHVPAALATARSGGGGGGGGSSSSSAPLPCLPETAEYLQVRKELAEARPCTFYNAAGLVVVRPARPGHYYALFAGTEEHDIVVSIYPGGRYEVELKYTSFVRTHRQTLPRVSMHPLAAELNAAETAEGFVWRADNVLDTGPLLRLEEASAAPLPKHMRYGAPSERPIHPSTIAPEEFEAVVAGYFERHLKGAPVAHQHTKRKIAAWNRELFGKSVSTA